MRDIPLDIILGGIAADDRGILRYVNDFDFTARGIRRMYQVENNDSCQIRAWHGHLEENKYVYCARGSAIISAIKMAFDGKGAPTIQKSFGATDAGRVTLSSVQPKILHIPAGMANGFRTLEPGTILQFFSTSTLEESKLDDYRFTYSPALERHFDIEIR